MTAPPPPPVIRAYYEARVEGLTWNHDGQGSGHCPFHEDRRKSFSANGHDGRSQCFAASCGFAGDIYAFEMAFSHCDFKTAKRNVLGELGGGDDMGGEGDQNQRPILTLADLAAAKMLSVDFLRDLPVRDAVDGQGVVIVYRLEDGSFAKRHHQRKYLSHEPDHWSFWSGSREDGDIVLYGLWRLAEARAAGYIVITEGESDCWTCWLHGIPAVCVPGARMVRVLEPRHLDGISRVYIAQDEGEGGEAFVQGVLGRLRGAWSGETLVIRALSHKDLSELHCDDPGRFEERWAKVLGGAVPAVSRVEVGEAQKPKLPEPQWPSDPDPAAFYGLAGEYVRAVEPYTEASPIALLVQFLLDFGSVIGRTAYFPIEDDKHYSNEDAVIVGPTAKGRKGTAESRVRSVFAACDPQWAQNRVKSGLSSGEGLIWHVRDAVWEKKPVKKGGRVVDYEDVETDPGVLDKRLCVIEPEFARVLKMTEREGNTLSPVVRQAWDSGNLNTLVTGRIHTVPSATNAHISVIGHITVDEVRRLLSATEQGNGFANRFTWYCVKRSKFLPEGGDLEACGKAIAPIIKKLKAVIQFVKKKNGLVRDAETRKEWAAIYQKLSSGRPGLLGAVTSRAEAHVVRFKSIYSLLDESDVIKPQHQEAALALWEFSEASCKYIFGDLTGDPDADAILSFLRLSPQGRTRTEISNLFGRNKAASIIARALNALLALGLVRREQQPTKGRDAEVWFAV
jgi:hypothetical protein